MVFINIGLVKIRAILTLSLKMVPVTTKIILGAVLTGCPGGSVR